MGSRRWIGIAVVAVLIPLGASDAGAARSSRGTLHDKVVSVGSFDFAESRLLAEVYSQALEGGHIRVRRAFGLGPREFVAPALAAGLVEFVPEYAGTALRFLSLGAATPGVDVADTHAALLDALDGARATALDAAPAQNANAFFVTRETASRYGVHKLSDLEAFASQLTFGGPPECATRPLCLPGLERVYGLEFDEFVQLDAGGPVTRQALRDRDVDIALLFTTDPTIANEGFVELEDDRGLQPAENVTPIVRTEVIDELGPRVIDLVNAVSRRLTTDVLRELNRQVARGDSSKRVASRWLRSQGLR
jgi:osmoprotectant transport system substrate-binding protein